MTYVQKIPGGSGVLLCLFETLYLLLKYLSYTYLHRYIDIYLVVSTAASSVQNSLRSSVMDSRPMYLAFRVALASCSDRSDRRISSKDSKVSWKMKGYHPFSNIHYRHLG